MRAFRKIFRLMSLGIMLVILAVVGYNIAMRYMYPLKMTSYVEKYSRDFGIDRETVYAVIKCESNFDPDAVSSAGAVGLMQITEETFYDVGILLEDEDHTFESHATDPEINIRYGTRYLKFLLDFFDGDKTAAIAAYNGGMGNVSDWMNGSSELDTESIEFRETKSYVKRVLAAEKHYKTLYD